MPKISVIVPVYKVEAYLSRCVESILIQSFVDFELILIDDGSPDNCGKICEDYANKDKRIVVIHKKNGGLSDARNVGIDWVFENSDSEWITFVDSDDWLHKEYLERLLDAAIENNVEVSSCGMCRTDGKVISESHEKGVVCCTPEKYWTDLKRGESYACGRLYRKKCFKDIRYPVGRLYEDSFTTYKILFRCKELALIHDELYYYFINPDSITNQNWSVKKLDAVKAHEEQLEFFRANGFDEAWKTTVDIYIHCLAQSADKLLKIKAERKRYKTIKRKLRKELSKHRKYILNWEKEKNHFYKVAYPTLFVVNKYIKKKISNLKSIIE